MILTKISQKPFPIKPSLEIRRILTPPRPSCHKLNLDFDSTVLKISESLNFLINMTKNQIFTERYQ